MSNLFETINVSPFTLNPITHYVVGTNSTLELRARTFLCALMQKDALSFVEYKEDYTLVLPSYVDHTSHLFQDFLKSTELGEGGVIFTKAEEPSSFVHQPGVVIFPASIEDTKMYLKHWLVTQSNYLSERLPTRRFVEKYIDTMLEKAKGNG